jgi:hypothetical protein
LNTQKSNELAHAQPDTIFRRYIQHTLSAICKIAQPQGVPCDQRGLGMLPQQGKTGGFQGNGNRLFWQSGYRFAQLAAIILESEVLPMVKGEDREPIDMNIPSVVLLRL